jgi:hypothetical protein
MDDQHIFEVCTLIYPYIEHCKSRKIFISLAQFFGNYFQPFGLTNFHEYFTTKYHFMLWKTQNLKQKARRSRPYTTLYRRRLKTDETPIM